MIEFVKELIPLSVILSQIISLALIIILFMGDSFWKSWISRYALVFGFIVALSAMLGSLFYSDVLNYEPCKFCWYQRIFMYPLVLILGIASWKNDFKIVKYVLPMSILGGLLSINHYILQITGTSILPCSAIGQSIACNKVFVLHYGYITIPLMALSAFVLITILMIYANRVRE